MSFRQMAEWPSGLRLAIAENAQGKLQTWFVHTTSGTHQHERSHGMNTSFLLLTLLAVSTNPTDQLARSIVENGHRRVGVVPLVITRTPDGETTASSTLGPRAATKARDLYEGLIAASKKGPYSGKFAVIPERTMYNALRNVTVEQLADPNVMKAVHEQTGADAVVTSTYEGPDVRKVDFEDEPNPTPGNGGTGSEGKTEGEALTGTLSHDLTDENGNATAHEEELDKWNLFTAAYGNGESWELVRWEGDTLTSRIGIEPLDLREGWEHRFYQRTRELRDQKEGNGLSHPYLVDDFPYALKIEVGGEVRTPRQIGEDFVVALNPDEEYKILLANRTDKDVYVALFVDGVCTIDKRIAEPQNLPVRQHWWLPKNSGDRRIQGWQTIPRDARNRPLGTPSYTTFQVVDAERSVARGAGFDQQIGMITAIFYTVGMPAVGSSARSLNPSKVGTGEGQRVEKALKWGSSEKRGVMLAAVTCYYRSDAELQELESGQGDDPVLDPGKGQQGSKGDQEIEFPK